VPRTKITVPELPVHFVSRPRLLTLLDRAAEAAVAVLRAPAGAGKTLLLAEWAHRHDGHVAFVSLDEDDRDDRRFWSAVLGALTARPRVPADDPLRTLEVPGRPSTDAAFLAELVDTLDARPAPVHLVLDGVDTLTGAPPQRALEALLRHQPGGLRLVLSGRRPPPVALARLRLADQLAEIGDDDLRFTRDETRALFAVSGAAVPPDTLERLADETGGWAVALRLAAASTVREGDLDEYFAGHDRAFAEYVAQEVLAGFDDARELVRALSVCEECTPELATAVSGRGDAAALLHELAVGGIGVRATGRPGRYRILPLLRTYLLADLGRRDPGRLIALHRAAADFFAGHGDPAAALGHCARAGDSDRTAVLLHAHASRLFLAGEHTALRQALGVLDAAVVARSPRLALIAAALCLEAGETGTADFHLRHAAAAWPAEPEPELLVLRQLARCRRAQLDGGAADIADTARGIDPGLARRTDLAGLARLQRTTGALVAGDDGTARAELEDVLRRAEADGQHHVAGRALVTLAELAAQRGDFRDLDRIVRRLDSAAAPPVAPRVIDSAVVGVLRAYRALLRSEPATCLRLLAPIVDPGSGDEGQRARVGDNVTSTARTLSGAARFDTGDWFHGIRAMRSGRLVLGDRDLPVEHAALAGLLEQRAALLLGDGDEARDVLRWCADRLGRRAEPLLMRARSQITLGRFASAAKALRDAEDARPVLPWTTVEVRLLVARVALHDGKRERARRQVVDALGVAERLDVWWPFVFAPEEVIALLTASLGRLGAREGFAVRLLARRRGLGVRAVPPPLTERERSVLRLLPTLRSIEEIAVDLTVSPNTVKTHVRGIYTKLGVNRRRDAVAIAVERGLFDLGTSGAED